MGSITNITIGIQARSTSSRFPKKVFERIGSKTMLNHVIDACFGSSIYLNRWADRNGFYVNVALCIPHDDEIKKSYSGDAAIVEGPEHDVLARYMALAQRYNSDYVVRVTADCPLIPAFLITKHINVAIAGEYDYVSNVDEKCRTAADGFDCEVISKKLLKYAHENASDPKDREHVTTYMRKSPPTWAKRGMIINFMDLSAYKLSVDTPEDLERVRAEYQKIDSAIKTAGEIYDSKNIHRF